MSRPQRRPRSPSRRTGWGPAGRVCIFLAADLLHHPHEADGVGDVSGVVSWSAVARAMTVRSSVLQSSMWRVTRPRVETAVRASLHASPSPAPQNRPHGPCAHGEAGLWLTRPLLHRGKTPSALCGSVNQVAAEGWQRRVRPSLSSAVLRTSGVGLRAPAEISFTIRSRRMGSGRSWISGARLPCRTHRTSQCSNCRPRTGPDPACRRDYSETRRRHRPQQHQTEPEA